MKEKSGQRTLLASVLLSAPGPLVVGAGLLVGRSSTQLADFIRRTAELAAIIVSWAVYRHIKRAGVRDEAKKARLERLAALGVGLAMCLGGLAMALIALFSRQGDKGNVLPGLVIALLGVITNTWFWLRYRRLNQKEPSAILAAQSWLYRAKSLVDLCVSAALMTVVLWPGSRAAYWMDAAGSLAVALYLIITGIGMWRRSY